MYYTFYQLNAPPGHTISVSGSHYDVEIINEKQLSNVVLFRRNNWLVENKIDHVFRSGGTFGAPDVDCMKVIAVANTYTQIHIHFVIAVKHRAALIGNEWKERLHQYLTGIIQQNNHKMLQVNSMPDHVHFFAGIRPDQSISSLMQGLKT